MYAIYFEPSFIRNNGSASSLSFNLGDSFTSFGPLNGADGNLDIDASSSRPDIPLNPEQSFGPIGIQGSGSFTALPYDPMQDPSGGFSIAFSLNTLSGTGLVPAVPLPASLPAFGAALLVLAGVGRARTRRGRPRTAPCPVVVAGDDRAGRITVGEVQHW